MASILLDVNSENPTVVIVSGAYHSPFNFSRLIYALGASGYDVISSRNPSCNSADPRAESVEKDTAFIRNNLLTLLNLGKDVVLTMHSYGSIPGLAAAKGLSKAERSAAGQPGGIISLFLITAIVLREGESLRNCFPNREYPD